MLWHDGQGMCLFAKRLERGRFVWPSTGAFNPSSALSQWCASRCQTAHLVPAAHVCTRGLRLCFTHPNRGVGGGPRDVRVPRVGAPLLFEMSIKFASVGYGRVVDNLLTSALSGLFPRAWPPGEKATARKNQARQTCSRDGTGDPAHAATRDSAVETESFTLIVSLNAIWIL